jgi:hypothetical protein
VRTGWTGFVEPSGGYWSWSSAASVHPKIEYTNVLGSALAVLLCLASMSKKGRFRLWWRDVAAKKNVAVERVHVQPPTGLKLKISPCPYSPMLQGFLARLADYRWTITVTHHV